MATVMIWQWYFTITNIKMFDWSHSISIGPSQSHPHHYSCKRCATWSTGNEDVRDEGVPLNVYTGVLWACWWIFISEILTHILVFVKIPIYESSSSRWSWYSSSSSSSSELLMDSRVPSCALLPPIHYHYHHLHPHHQQEEIDLQVPTRALQASIHYHHHHQYHHHPRQHHHHRNRCHHNPHHYQPPLYHFYHLSWFR